jgi:hypothetical protein
VLSAALFFGEEAYGMGAPHVIQAGDIEPEETSIIEFSLMVQKQTSYQTEIHTVTGCNTAINLKYGYPPIPVDFVTGWMRKGAYCAVVSVFRFCAKEREAKFAAIEGRKIMEGIWGWGIVPGLHSEMRKPQILVVLRLPEIFNLGLTSI